MLKCINKECTYCNNGKCEDEKYIRINFKGNCKNRIKLPHIPNYAEEQLEHVEQQEETLIKISKKEIDDYEELLNNQSISIKEYMKENENLKEENKKLTEELESLKYQFAGVQQIIKENERKLYNYESIKGLIKILYEGL
ncbi:hypothetical protein [Clostridium saccharoperbutylacetonicum]|uniref:hypothetical protein n=1 Tax=Clostridium saccharoperbutylacetonicum TaxID=36745 RepID=UPI0039E7479A